MLGIRSLPHACATPPVADGLFYLAAPVALRAQVAARPPPKLLITPHAGYEHCGADGPRC